MVGPRVLYSSAAQRGRAAERAQDRRAVEGRMTRVGPGGWARWPLAWAVAGAALAAVPAHADDAIPAACIP